MFTGYYNKKTTRLQVHHWGPHSKLFFVRMVFCFRYSGREVYPERRSRRRESIGDHAQNSSF